VDVSGERHHRAEHQHREKSSIPSDPPRSVHRWTRRSDSDGDSKQEHQGQTRGEKEEAYDDVDCSLHGKPAAVIAKGHP
jgi:hypothetical protein